MKGLTMNDILNWTEMYIISFCSLLFMDYYRIIWCDGVGVSSLKNILGSVPRVYTVLVKTSSFSLVAGWKDQWLEDCIIFIHPNIDVVLQNLSFFIYIGPKNDFTLLVAETIQKYVNLSKDLISCGATTMEVVEHGAKNMSMKRWYLWWKWNTLPLNHLQVFFHAHAMIAGLAGQHLVEDNPKGPNITFLWVIVFPVCLRRHILGRANVIVKLRLVGHFLHLAIPEVNDGHFLAFLRIGLKEDVIWLQVSMYDLLISHMRVSFDYLPKNEKRFILIKPLRVFFDIVS